MTPDDVIAGLRAFLADMLDLAPESIRPESTLFDDLDVDSLSVLELAVFSEETYDVDLEPLLREAHTAGNRAEVTLAWLADRIVAARSPAPSQPEAAS
ncbi:acyl carrier protein [Microbacterium sp. SL75]|uniref:acyl carrier protein n=1 Tax=Microbacterium sp. SL75 TaxID=2995140 RepID=UPI002271C9C3|nr:phosphopantetheine-binding protein [Microbacterium sp. SL75]WAC69276.1 phosphopantetheine-binding protein [Microbacterium sp. SL75]